MKSPAPTDLAAPRIAHLENELRIRDAALKTMTKQRDDYANDLLIAVNRIKDLQAEHKQDMDNMKGRIEEAKEELRDKEDVARENERLKIALEEGQRTWDADTHRLTAAWRRIEEQTAEITRLKAALTTPAPVNPQVAPAPRRRRAVMSSHARRTRELKRDIQVVHQALQHAERHPAPSVKTTRQVWNPKTCQWQAA